MNRYSILAASLTVLLAACGGTEQDILSEREDALASQRPTHAPLSVLSRSPHAADRLEAGLFCVSPATYGCSCDAMATTNGIGIGTRWQTDDLVESAFCQAFDELIVDQTYGGCPYVSARRRTPVGNDRYTYRTDWSSTCKGVVMSDVVICACSGLY